MNLAQHRVQHLRIAGYDATIVDTRIIRGVQQSLIVYHKDGGHTTDDGREWVETGEDL